MKVQDLKPMAQGSGLRVQSSGFRVLGKQLAIEPPAYAEMRKPSLLLFAEANKHHYDSYKLHLHAFTVVSDHAVPNAVVGLCLRSSAALNFPPAVTRIDTFDSINRKF